MKPAGKAGDPRPPQSPAAQRPNGEPDNIPPADSEDVLHSDGAAEVPHRSATRPRKSTTPPNIGRPSLNTPETRAAILEALALGNTVKDSCLGAGVGYSTVREWATADLEFADALEKAQAQARQKMVAIIMKSAPGSWAAAMTYLERRDPEHWGRRDRVSMTVDLNREARRLANETGLDEAAILAEAEALLRNG